MPGDKARNTFLFNYTQHTAIVDPVTIGIK
jgi:hypothetical protein